MYKGSEKEMKTCDLLSISRVLRAKPQAEMGFGSHTALITEPSTDETFGLEVSHLVIGLFSSAPLPTYPPPPHFSALGGKSQD